MDKIHTRQPPSQPIFSTAEIAMIPMATKVIPVEQRALEDDHLPPLVERLAIDNPDTLAALNRLPPRVWQHLASLLLGENHNGSLDASLLAAAEQWNDEDPDALFALELLPQEVLEYITSHILGGDIHSTGEADENNTKQMTLYNPPRRSTLENLPTEVIQHLARYLIGGINCKSDGSCYAGLLEFRAVSRAIRAKTDYVFIQSFTVHAVDFNLKSILGLFELSNCEALRSQIRTLVFVAPKHCKDGQPSDRTYWQRVSEAIELPEIRDLLLHDSVETALLAVALRRFSLSFVYVAPNLNKLYPEELRERNASIGGHPPTIILNAILLSGTKVQKWKFGANGWGTYHGINPAAMRLGRTVLQLKPRFEALTVLKLHLTGNSGPDEVYGLQAMLEQCCNLTRLTLSLDKKTTEDFWPDLTIMQSTWDMISSLRWQKLTDLVLSGFVITMETLQPFLDFHKRSLSSLRFGFCFLYGDWVSTFRSLKDSPTLEKLILDQISAGQQRVVWRLTRDDVTDALDDEDKDEWVWISTIGMRLNFIPCPTYIDCLLSRARISVKDANPRALDALRWEELELRL